MIHYVEAGHSEVSYRFESGFPSITSSQRQAIDENWNRIVATNSNAFNGEIYCCHGFEHRTNLISLNRSNYATYSWARSHQIALPGAYAAGDDTLLYNPEKEAYIFSVRSGLVGFDQDKISTTSGGVLNAPEYPVLADEFQNFVDQHSRQETAEELHTHGLTDSALLGFYIDDSNYKLEYLYIARAIGYSLQGNESVELLEIPATQVHRFFQENEFRFELSTLHHLRHWSKRLSHLDFT